MNATTRQRSIVRIVRAGTLAVVFLTWASTAHAQWWQDGIDWGGPIQSRVGDCLGNCGAGCSGDVNPCGGPPRYWQLEILAGPSHVGDSYYEACNGIGELWGYGHQIYQALGRWTFHGQSKTGCFMHDVYCNQWILGCALYFGCGQVTTPDTWTYTEWIQGYTYYYNQVGLC